MKTAPGRLASPCTLTGRLRPLSVSHLFGPSDHRARAELEPRVGLPPCSPASFPVVTRGEGPVCGPHKRRALKVNRRNYRRSREDAARPRTIAELGEDVGPGDPSTGISVLRGGPGAQPSDAFPRVRPGPTPCGDARDPGMAGVNLAPSAYRDTRPFPAEA